MVRWSSVVTCGCVFLSGALARAQDAPPRLVVVVEAHGGAAQAELVREALASALRREVVELTGEPASDDVTLVSVVVGPERGAVTVRTAGGPQMTRGVAAEGRTRDATWVVPHVAALVSEVESAPQRLGLASWTGRGTRDGRVLPAGLLPWPDDETIRRGARQRAPSRTSGAEDGAGLSAPSPSGAGHRSSSKPYSPASTYPSDM